MCKGVTESIFALRGLHDIWFLIFDFCKNPENDYGLRIEKCHYDCKSNI